MIRKCKRCGKEFEPYHIKRLYCCDTCRTAYNNAKKIAKEKALKQEEKVLEVKPKAKAVLSISQIVDLARANGMDYGYYVAKYKV